MVRNKPNPSFKGKFLKEQKSKHGVQGYASNGKREKTIHSTSKFLVIGDLGSIISYNIGHFLNKLHKCNEFDSTKCALRMIAKIMTLGRQYNA